MYLKKEFLIDAVHVFVLLGFAVTQPLFDLLTRYPEFFVTHHCVPIDVVSLILILCVLLPLFVVLIELIAGLFGRKSRKCVHGFIVMILLTVIVLPALNKIFNLSGAGLLVGAAVLGVAGTVVYTRFHPARIFITVLSVALLIFPSLFLFNAQIFKIVFPKKVPSILGIKSSNSPPIIFVVFDEFPTTSLMDENHKIDPIRYPNFAAFSRDAYWFSNNTTVGERTNIAIPAILCGCYPDQFRLPTITDYPNNLFTLLGNSYNMKVFESDTMLCPEELREGKNSSIFDLQRLHIVLSDLSVVYLHIILPSDLTSWLPVVTQTWKGFISEKKVSGAEVQNILARKRKSIKDHFALFETFLESITVSNKPTLYFLHIELPHIPWRYLPSGKTYANKNLRIPGLDIKTDKWDANEWLVIQAYQRHLLQVGFMDKMVGDLVAKLRALNLYRQSLIILTADHGVGFWPNTIRRMIFNGHPEDILPVPLFIKVPNQKGGGTVDSNVEVVDILPSIIDILDIHVPWSLPGSSLVAQPVPDRVEKTIYDYRFERFLFDSTNLIDAQDRSLKRKLKIFGSGSKPYGLFKIGPYGELVGRNVDEISMGGQSKIEINFDKPNLLFIVDTESAFIPAQIKGNVVLKEDTADPLYLAIAINGMISAVTKTFWHKKGKAQFSAMVPESAFRKGRNNVEVFVLFEDKGKIQLMRTKNRAAVSYAIAASNEHGEIITSSDGTSIPVVPNALDGWLDSANVNKEFIVFSGWGADVHRSRPPKAVVAFINGKFIYSGITDVDRPDVAEYFNNMALQRTGFKVMLPSSVVTDTANPDIRFFAVTDTVASELKYNKEYKWKRN